MDNFKVGMELLRVAKDITAAEFSSPQALQDYLHKHPNADRSNHRVVSKHPNGKTEMDWHFNEDGKRHGPQKIYDEYGRIKDDHNFKDGLPHGRQRSYKDGVLKSESNWKDGILHGRSVSYRHRPLHNALDLGGINGTHYDKHYKNGVEVSAPPTKKSSTLKELKTASEFITAAWDDMGPNPKAPNKRIWRDNETGEVRWQISAPRTESKEDGNKPVPPHSDKPTLPQVQTPTPNVGEVPKNGTKPLNEKEENIQVPSGVLEKTDELPTSITSDGYNRDITIPPNPKKMIGQDIDVPDDVWNSHAELSVKAKKMALGMLAADPMLSEFSSEEQRKIKNVATKSIAKLTAEMFQNKHFRENVGKQKAGVIDTPKKV